MSIEYNGYDETLVSLKAVREAIHAVRELGQHYAYFAPAKEPLIREASAALKEAQHKLEKVLTS